MGSQNLGADLRQTGWGRGTKRKCFQSGRKETRRNMKMRRMWGNGVLPLKEGSMGVGQDLENP